MKVLPTISLENFENPFLNAFDEGVLHLTERGGQEEEESPESKPDKTKRPEMKREKSDSSIKEAI